MNTPKHNNLTQERIYKVILGPHVTEKGSILAEMENQYVFKIAQDATKPEVKQAVEALFNVEVEKVQTVNIKGKQKRFKQSLGRRNAVRKAYVKLKKGQDIKFAGKEGA